MTCSFRPRGFLKTQWPCLQGRCLPTVSTHQRDQGDFLSSLHQCSPRNSKSFLGVPPAQVPSQHTLDGMWPPQPAGGEADSSLCSRGPPHPPCPDRRLSCPLARPVQPSSPGNHISCLPDFEVGSLLLVLAH